MVEMLTVPTVGEHARFTPSERASIEPPLGRILAKMDPKRAAAISAISDPLLLGVGLLMWSMRVFKTQGGETWQNSQSGQRPTPIRRETPSANRPSPAQPPAQSAPVTAVYPEEERPEGFAVTPLPPTQSIPVPGAPEPDLISAWGVGAT